MARFLLAWELGGGMGHVMRLAPIAHALHAQGHALHLVLRDLSGADAALGDLAASPRVTLWQAPMWLPQLRGLPAPAVYAELLFRAGYLDAVRLLALVRAWQALLDAIAPDLLLADHAPTALLAARGRPLRRAVLCNGFFLPPAVQPMPPFREWERNDTARLAQSEARALVTCNAVMAATGGPPLSALHDLLAADAQFLLTWPELDHYGAGPQGRPGGHYWGALAARDHGLPALWPEGDGEPLFAYLKADYPAIDAVLQQLAAAPSRTLAHVPGLDAAQRLRHTSAQLRFSDAAVSMVSAMAQARAVLCHAGAGSVAAALQAGLPLLMLPTQAEQMLSARRVAACGAGQWLLQADAGPRLLPVLARVLGDPALRQRTQALAARHPPARDGNVALRVAERCIALASA